MDSKVRWRKDDPTMQVNRNRYFEMMNELKELREKVAELQAKLNHSREMYKRDAG